MDKKPTRIYQLTIETLKTLEDVKVILNALKIRIDTDDPSYERLKKYFTVEVVPPGYPLVVEKVGYERLNQMTLDEIEEMAVELLTEKMQKMQDEETN